MKVLTKVSGAWKQVRKLFIKQGTTWKQVKKTFVKQSGVWKQVYAAIAEVPMACVTYDISPYGNGVQTAQAIASPSYPDHGGAIRTVVMDTNYDGSDRVYSWIYQLQYDSAAGAPNWNGSLKVTNKTSGDFVVMPKTGARLWTLEIFRTSGGDFPLNPHNNWIRNATDVFKIEEA